MDMRKLDALTKLGQGTTQPARKGGKGMATVRSIASSILVALIVMVGHASARTMNDYDYIHHYLAVSHGTHIGNGLGYDVNRDGRWDAYRFSTLANGYFDGVALDLSGNGSFTAVRFYMDTTGSGRFDVTFEINASGQYYALDPDEDGHYTAWASLTAQPAQSQPQPQPQPQRQPTIDGMPLQVAQILHDHNRRMADIWLRPTCYSCR
jgi:hypothetical protein